MNVALTVTKETIVSVCIVVEQEPLRAPTSSITFMLDAGLVVPTFGDNTHPPDGNSVIRNAL